MRTSRVLATVLFTACLGAFLATSAAGLTTGEAGMTLTSAGRSVVAKQGSFCGQSNGAILCADSAYPLKVKCKLPVKPHGTVVVETLAAAKTVDAVLVDDEGEVTNKRLRPASPDGGAEGKTWRFKLPKGIRDYAAISASATYDGGDSNTWTGLKTRTCRGAGFSG